MQLMQLVIQLGRNDARLIRRDSFLIVMLGFILAISLLLRFALPLLNEYLASTGVLPSETIRAHLSDYYPLIIGFLAIFEGAVIVGTMFGFLLLDEKDDNTLVTILVSPIPLHWYLMYRIGIPVALATLLIAAQMLFINLSLVPFGKLMLLSAGASLTAPIISLFFVIFADNKVQGFAYSKFTGVAGWVIIIGFFVAEPAQWLFGLFPPFLINKAYWMALEGAPLWWTALLSGVLLQLGLIALMMRWFRKSLYR